MLCLETGCRAGCSLPGRMVMNLPAQEGACVPPCSCCLMGWLLKLQRRHQVMADLRGRSPEGPGACLIHVVLTMARVFFTALTPGVPRASSSWRHSSKLRRALQHHAASHARSWPLQTLSKARVTMHPLLQSPLAGTPE